MVFIWRLNGRDLLAHCLRCDASVVVEIYKSSTVEMWQLNGRDVMDQWSKYTET
jgi:hypothetical protein